MKRVSFNDAVKGNPHEVMKSYKMNKEQFQAAVREHCRDAPRHEIASFERDVYDRNKWSK